MPIKGYEIKVVYKVVADPLDSLPITSIDPTQKLTGSEFVSREIDAVIIILLFCSLRILFLAGHWVSVTYLTQLIPSWTN